MGELEQIINNYEYHTRMFLKTLSAEDINNLELTTLDIDDDSIGKIINLIIKGSLAIETRGRLLETSRTARGNVDVQKMLEDDYKKRLLSLNKVLSCTPLQELIRVEQKLSYKEEKQKIR